MKAVELDKTGGPEVIKLKDITLDKPGQVVTLLTPPDDPIACFETMAMAPTAR